MPNIKLEVVKTASKIKTGEKVSNTYNYPKPVAVRLSVNLTIFFQMRLIPKDKILKQKWSVATG
jgi:hypothetical protein